MPVRNRKRGLSKHSGRKDLPVVSYRMCEGAGRWNPVIIRINLQVQNELQLLPFRFALRYRLDWSDYFCFPSTLFLAWNINPVLEEIFLNALCPIQSCSDRGILPSSATHAFSSLSSR